MKNGELSPADILSSDDLNNIGQRLKLIQTADRVTVSVAIDAQALLDDAVALYRHSKALSIGINIEIDTR